MGATVRISAKAAKELVSALDAAGGFVLVDGRAVSELRSALQVLDRRAQRHRPAKRAAREKKAARKEKRADVRGAVEFRAGNICECGCGRYIGPNSATRPELDHFEGRARSESVETCWLLADVCHMAKTQNHPDAARWLGLWIDHLDRHAGKSEGYGEAARRAKARLAFVETRAALGGSMRRSEGAR